MNAEQRIVTDYFNAAKSRQGFQPAKRRKIALDDGATLLNRSKETIDASSSSLASVDKTIPIKGTPTIASSKTKQTRSSRSTVRKSKKSATRRNVVAEKGIIAEGVNSEATSMKDDHDVDRPRKRRTVLSNDNELNQSQKPQKDDERRETKDGADGHGPCSEDKVSVVSTVKPNIVQQKSALKIHPWISDQAKVVMATRGRRALNKSLARNESKVGPTAKSEPMEKKEILTPKRSVDGPKPKTINVQPRLHQAISTAASQNTPASKEESASKLPAYKRFDYLLQAKKPKPASSVVRNLPLPYHFKVLEEMFRCVDVVLSLKQKRYETCTFDKLKESVQEMCRKTFEKKHLAQMKNIYPSAFLFQQQSGCRGQKKSVFQLTVDFKLDESAPGDEKKKNPRFLESSVLIARQKQFKKELLKITMSHHRDYLKTNHPSLSVDDEAIMRWHPCFHLDEVPEINPSPLPEAPQANTYTTAQDVLDRARQKMAPRVEKSLSLVAQKSKDNSAESKKDIPKIRDCQPKTQNASLKGISQSLIEKIRHKEEKKIQESLTIDPHLLQKRVMVQRLPELCRILRTYFISEHKAAIPLEDACNKLAESCTSTLSSVQVEKHLKLLSELAPEWLSIMHVRKCPYVKLKKNANINNLIEKLKCKEIN